MQTTTRQTAEETRLWISNWTYPRHAITEEDGTTKVEIARTACRHCPTCAWRIRTIAERLSQQKDWGWETRGAGVYLVLRNGREPGESTASYLERILGMRVEEARRRQAA